MRPADRAISKREDPDRACRPNGSLGTLGKAKYCGGLDSYQKISHHLLDCFASSQRRNANAFAYDPHYLAWVKLRQYWKWDIQIGAVHEIDFVQRRFVYVACRSVID